MERHGSFPTGELGIGGIFSPHRVPIPRTTSSAHGAPQQRSYWLLWLTLPLSLLWLIAPEARAESRTAESIWSQSDATQRAIDQVPPEARESISQTRCQEVGVGRMGSLPRFRCTVWFDPPTPPAKP